MYALSHGREVDIDVEELNNALGRVPHARVQGFTVKDGDSADNVITLLNMSDNRGRTTQAFVFQSDPKKWDIVTALVDERSGNYAVNQMRSQIGVGDTIYFRRTGQASGIYAIGTVTSLPENTPNDFGDWTCGYDITHAVRPALLTSDIKNDPVLGTSSELKGYQYTNALLDPDVRRRLDDVLKDRQIRLSEEDGSGITEAEREIDGLANPRRTRRRGQGYGLTAAQRRAVEIRAVRVATDYLVDEGWDVEDVGDRRSYDLHATQGKKELLVEVKGTTNNGETVLLTRNEVNIHRDNYPHTALIIVQEIRLRNTDNGPLATGGSLAIHRPWQPAEDDLEALSFRYRVPAN